MWIRSPSADAKTCVFWNVEDYPIPSGSDPVSMGQKIKSALAVENIRGELSIKAYVDKKNTLSDELRDKYIDAGITVNPIPEGEYIISLLFHLCLFYLLILTLDTLQGMHTRGLLHC